MKDKLIELLTTESNFKNEQIKHIAVGLMSHKERKLHNKAGFKSDLKGVKMPYHMLMGMKKKAKQKIEEEKEQERALGYVADSG